MRHALFAPAAALALAACSATHARSADRAPPRAEFLVSTADSTFWVSTAGGRIDLRGAPLLLARYGGRFYEVYTADDDYSYEDALLVGERLYRRDLMSGDSAVIFTDTLVPRVAMTYAHAHPDERPLAPDEDGAENPSTSATAELDILTSYGPYLSYEYHVDVAMPGREPWHATRRGVLDLRSGKNVTAAELFGDSAAARLSAQAQQAYAAERDSVLRRGGGDETPTAAMRALASLRFDPSSFTLSDEGGRAMVEFALPTRGRAAGGNALELDPIAASTPAWWPAVRPSLPTTDDGGADRWAHGGYAVVARYDTSGGVARLSLVDSSRREWAIATVGTPLHRIDWLDDPRITAAERRALARAFDQAATYDENARTASYHYQATHPTSRIPLPALANALVQNREGKPARNVGAHDAGAREQHGPRVRRRDSVDDGQMRRDRRVSAQPRGRRHRVDRPGRLS